MESIIVVADTGPIVALAKVDRLDLLSALFTKILIPPAVERELYAKRSAESKLIEAAVGTLIQVAEHPEFSVEVQAVVGNLDIGEAEAIALAFNSSFALLLDEARGRRAAERLGVAVVGSVGIILESKRRDLLPAAGPVLLQMRQQGYWLSDDLIAQATAIVGERLE